MKTRNGSERIQVLKPKIERVTLVPEQMIAVIGCALMARYSSIGHSSTCTIAAR